MTLSGELQAPSTLAGLVTDRRGLFGGYAQNLITLNDSAHTAGTPPYNPPIIGLEVDVLSAVGGVTSGTTHVGLIGYSALKTTPFTYASGLEEYWQGGFFLGGATTGCGGTLPANPCATIWGMASIATLYSGATGFDAVISGEFDVATYAGSSTNNRMGVLIVDLDSTVAAGVGYDAAIEITAGASAVKFRYGIDFGGYSGASPVTATGTLIGASIGQSVGEIIDLHNVTCTGTNALKFANGFAVTCSGALQMPVGIIYTGSGSGPFNFLNSTDLPFEIRLRGGASASQVTNLSYADFNGTVKWDVYKDASNNFTIRNEAAAVNTLLINPANALTLAVSGMTITGLPTVAAGTGKNFVCIDPATNVMSRGTGATCI
jgi:hypothetical protein